jgi:hypothetical protein
MMMIVMVQESDVQHPDVVDNKPLQERHLI